MQHRLSLLFLLGSLLAPGLALAGSDKVTDPALPRSLETTAPVQVSWDDPATFTEIRHSGNRAEAERGTWVTDLASYLADAASTRLDNGQQLSVRLTDIDRAGDYEPWLGPVMRDVRMMRDIYPPKIKLEFALHDASGQVVAQGERSLGDLGYLQGLVTAHRNTDALRYEKKLLDRWLQQEFGPAHKLTAGH